MFCIYYNLSWDTYENGKGPSHPVGKISQVLPDFYFAGFPNLTYAQMHLIIWIKRLSPFSTMLIFVVLTEIVLHKEKWQFNPITYGWGYYDHGLRKY